MIDLPFDKDQHLRQLAIEKLLNALNDCLKAEVSYRAVKQIVHSYEVSFTFVRSNNND